MSKHTPGPWGKKANGDSTFVPLRAHHCERLGVSIGFVSWDDEGEPAANARLIAAAPDLAFQLRAASNYIDALGGDSKSYRAAIAKATGEQS